MTPTALAAAILAAHADGGIDLELVEASWLIPDIVATSRIIADASPDAYTALLELRRQYPPSTSYDREMARLSDQADGSLLDAYAAMGWDDPVEVFAHPLARYLIDWDQFWTEESPGEDWLIRPLFARGRGHAVFAGAKTGKSWTVLAACAALATGRAFIGHQNPPATILYVDYEMTQDDVRERLESFGYGPGDDLSRLHYALLVSLPPLNTPEGGQALLEAAQAVGAELVVVDTIGRAVDGEENSNDVIRDFYTHTGKVLKREGITVVRLDHAGKNAEKGQRGGSAKNDDVDLVWRVGRTDGGQLWSCTHQRMSWVPEKVSIDVAEDDDGIFEFRGEGPTWMAGTAALAAELDRAGVPADVSERTVRSHHAAVIEACKSAGLKTSNAVLRDAIKYRKQTFQAPKSAPEMAGAVDSGDGASSAGAHSGAAQNPLDSLTGAHVGAVGAPLNGESGAERHPMGGATPPPQPEHVPLDI